MFVLPWHLRAPGTDCYPSVLVTTPTHIKAAIPDLKNPPAEIYAQDQLFMSLSIYSQFCSPFLMLGSKSIFRVVQINTSIKFQWRQQYIYCALLLGHVPAELGSFSEGCQGTPSAYFTKDQHSLFLLSQKDYV